MASLEDSMSDDAGSQHVSSPRKDEEGFIKHIREYDVSLFLLIHQSQTLFHSKLRTFEKKIFKCF
jgi:hypothetical protein